MTSLKTFDPESQMSEQLKALHESHVALHDKFDQMLGHLATIAGAVQKPEEPPNAPPQSSRGATADTPMTEADTSG